VCFKGLLKEKYLKHIALLSQAMYILSQKSVTKSELLDAHNLLCSFIFYFQEYYGEHNMVYNVHLLYHICKGVLNWGPLWTHNAFAYESQNRFLLQLLKSPRLVSVQVAKRYLTYKELPQICEKLATSDMAISFVENLFENRLTRFVKSGSGILLGKGEIFRPNFVQIDIISGHKPHATYPCLSYQRALCNGIRITTASYSDGKKSNDSYVFLRSGTLINVLRILKFEDNSAAVYGLPIIYKNEFIVNGLKHLRQFQRYGDMICVDLNLVEVNCISMQIEDKLYFCQMPYGCHGD
jgi:hypothetical protein